MSLASLRGVASIHPSRLDFVSTQKMQSFSASDSSMKSGSSQMADVIFVVIAYFFFPFWLCEFPPKLPVRTPLEASHRSHAVETSWLCRTEIKPTRASQPCSACNEKSFRATVRCWSKSTLLIQSQSLGPSRPSAARGGSTPPSSAHPQARCASCQSGKTPAPPLCGPG